LRGENLFVERGLIAAYAGSPLKQSHQGSRREAISDLNYVAKVGESDDD